MIDKIAWIHTLDGKVLSTRSEGKAVYYLPGGKREGNESDLETLVREIREELSVEILPDTAKLFGIFEAQAHGKAEGVIVRMTCYTADYRGTLRPDSEVAELVWLDASGAERSSPVDRLIFTELKSRGMIG